MSHRSLLAPRGLAALAVGSLVLGAALVQPAAAATTTSVTNVGELKQALGPGCADGDVVEVAADMAQSDADIAVSCTLTLTLEGRYVSVQDLAIAADKTLTLTDPSSTSTAGTLTADASAAPGFAGISTGASGGLSVTGNANLVAAGGDDTAGIGGDDLTAGGTVDLEGGGDVTATGGVFAAGIGGGRGASGGSITIEGTGRLESTAGEYAAGIGGGSDGAGAVVVIGGSVQVVARPATASTNAQGGAGIGGGGTGYLGVGGAGDQVTIGGTSSVTATGSGGGAGIGGGGHGDGGTLTLDDSAEVTATGGTYAAGVGGGFKGAGGTVTTNDHASLDAESTTYGAGIGGGDGFGDSPLETSGGTTTVNDNSRVRAVARSDAGAGDGGAGIGGGPGGAGGTLTIAGGDVTASSTTTAVGGGDTGGGIPSPFGSLTISSGVLHLPDNIALRVADGPGTEVTVGAAGTITGVTDPASPDRGQGYLQRGDDGSVGQILNDGTITLPTANVYPTPVEHHYYDISFDVAGGHSATGSTQIHPVAVYAASFADGDRAFPAEPSRPGFTFAGWFTGPHGTGSPVTATSVLPGSSQDGQPVALTAYADYRPVPPRVAISGIAADGRTLTAHVSGPTQDPDYRVAYQWNQNGRPVPGRGHRASFPVRPRQDGKTISVTVRVSYPGSPTLTTTRKAGRAKRSQHYVTTGAANASPGDHVYLYARGPATATHYRLLTPAGAVTGKVARNGLVRSILTAPDTCGRIHLTIVMKDRKGHRVYRASTPLVIKNCSGRPEHVG